MYEADMSGAIQSAIDSSLEENDRFKQRAAAEMLAGLLRGTCLCVRYPLVVDISVRI